MATVKSGFAILMLLFALLVQEVGKKQVEEYNSKFRSRSMKIKIFFIKM